MLRSVKVSVVTLLHLLFFITLWYEKATIYHRTSLRYFLLNISCYGGDSMVCKQLPCDAQ